MIDESIKKKRREAAADSAKKTEHKTEQKAENKPEKRTEKRTENKSEKRPEKNPGENKKRDNYMPRPQMAGPLCNQGAPISFAEVPVFPQQGPSFHRGSNRGDHNRSRGYQNPRGGRGQPQVRGGLSANIQVQFQPPPQPQVYTNPGVYHGQPNPSGHFVGYPQQGAHPTSYGGPPPPPYDGQY